MQLETPSWKENGSETAAVTFWKPGSVVLVIMESAAPKKAGF